MSAILSHPFRLAPNGTVATVEQDSDQANAEQIGVLLLTFQGERPLAPGFGVPDPSFRGIPAGVITGQVARYGPRVTVRTVTAVAAGDAELDIQVTFT